MVALAADAGTPPSVTEDAGADRDGRIEIDQGAPLFDVEFDERVERAQALDVGADGPGVEAVAGEHLGEGITVWILQREGTLRGDRTGQQARPEAGDTKPGSLLRARRPNVTLDLQPLTSDQQIEALQAGTLDVGIVRDEIRLNMGSSVELTSEVVFEEFLVACLPVDHPLAQRSEVTAEENIAVPMITYPRSLMPGYVDRVAAVLDAAPARCARSRRCLSSACTMQLATWQGDDPFMLTFRYGRAEQPQSALTQPDAHNPALPRLIR